MKRYTGSSHWLRVGLLTRTAMASLRAIRLLTQGDHEGAGRSFKSLAIALDINHSTTTDPLWQSPGCALEYGTFHGYFAAKDPDGFNSLYDPIDDLKDEVDAMLEDAVERGIPVKIVKAPPAMIARGMEHVPSFPLLLMDEHFA